MNTSKRESASRVIAWVVCAVSLFGVGTRFALSRNLLGVVDLIGYFTVLSNLAVIGAVAGALFGRRSPASLRSAERRYAAICLYIAITGIVYQTLLGPGLDASGLDLVVLNINHGLTPLLYLLWYIVRPKARRLAWRDAFRFLVFPAIYGTAAVLEGTIRGKYRYFFLDARTLGAAAFVLWIGVIAAVFYLGGIGIIAIGRAQAKSGTSGERRA
jgi:hypothetical protein